MPPIFDSVILGDVVSEKTILTDGWIAISGERIAAIGQGTPPEAHTRHDYSQDDSEGHPAGTVRCKLFPGLVDGHMHTGSAIGFEGIEGATRSAAAGGVTTCIDMPYDVPLPVTDVEVLAQKIDWVERTAHVDMALYGTIRREGGVPAIAGLADSGVCAFKLSTYQYDPVRFPRIDHPTMIDAFAAIAGTGRAVSVHNEDQELVEALTARARTAGQTHPIMHARTRPPLAETLADLEIFEIGMATGAHVHMAHSSLARGFDIAKNYRNQGAQATGETCIQYLAMTEDDLVRLGGRGKCNPPFRTGDEVEALWSRLLADEIAYVSTDHAPWPAERKNAADIFACGAGLIGLQSFAPLFATLLEERGLPLTLLATYAAERSARLHGLYPRKGTLAVGSDADIAVLQPADYLFDEAQIVDRPELRWSPYHGRRMRARVVATYLRGRLIWDGQQVLATPGQGRFLKRS